MLIVRLSMLIVRHTEARIHVKHMLQRGACWCILFICILVPVCLAFLINSLSVDMLHCASITILSTDHSPKRGECTCLTQSLLCLYDRFRSYCNLTSIKGAATPQTGYKWTKPKGLAFLVATALPHQGRAGEYESGRFFSWYRAGTVTNQTVVPVCPTQDFSLEGFALTSTPLEAHSSLSV